VRELAELLAEMRDAGVILDYALFGALAQVRYTEPVLTLDADVLVVVPSPERLDVLRDIYAFCAERGHPIQGEAVRVGAWPTQFVPVFSDLTREAVAEAESVRFEGAPLRVVRAAHLAVIALSVGRAKDLARIVALLEAGVVTRAEIEQLASRHGLGDRWRSFATRFFHD